MAETESKPVSIAPSKSRRNAGEIVFDSAFEAASGAFVVWILGGVAISIAAAFAGDMIPSLPPGFGAEGAAKSRASLPGNWWHLGHGGVFWLLFVNFFAHSLWTEFYGPRHGGGAGRRARHILAKLREDWFGLIVGNAIGAWAASLAASFALDFSLSQMVWHWFWDQAQPVFHAVGRSVLGASNAHALGDWARWYGANQGKLNFWILYLAGACDDLGLPNIKTLARWAWRRTQKRKRNELDVSTAAGSAGEVDSNI